MLLNSDGNLNNSSNINKVNLHGLCVLNDLFRNISAISQLEALFVEETGSTRGKPHYQVIIRNQNSCGTECFDYLCRNVFPETTRVH
jgi:hypothetical protein